MHIKDRFGGIILLSVILGLLFPSPGLFFTPYLQYLLMALMFISVVEVKWKDILKNLKDFKHIILVLLIIHGLTGVLALFFKGILTPELYLGLVLIAVAPSGLSAVFLSHLCKGKPSEALTLTSISNLLSPISMPLLVLLFAKTRIEVSVVGMFWTVFKLIVIPFLVAQLIKYLPGRKEIISFSQNISIPLLVIIIWGITAPTRAQLITAPQQVMILFGICSLMILSDFFAGWISGKKHKDRVTFAITSSYKNFTLATVVALSLFDPIVALPAVIYTIANNVWLAPMHWFFERNLKRA
jgi:BASS family bile acid:Na+ symporter